MSPYLSPLHGPIHPDGARNLERGGRGALAALRRDRLGQFLLLDLVDGGLVQEDVDGAQVDVEGEGDGILGDGLGVEVHVEGGGAADGGLDEGVVAVPEAGVAGVGGEDPDVLVALAREGDHEDDAGVG